MADDFVDSWKKKQDENSELHASGTSKMRNVWCVFSSKVKKLVGK